MFKFLVNLFTGKPKPASGYLEESKPIIKSGFNLTSIRQTNCNHHGMDNRKYYRFYMKQIGNFCVPVIRVEYRRDIN